MGQGRQGGGGGGGVSRPHAGRIGLYPPPSTADDEAINSGGSRKLGTGGGSALPPPPNPRLINGPGVRAPIPRQPFSFTAIIR